MNKTIYKLQSRRARIWAAIRPASQAVAVKQQTGLRMVRGTNY